MQNTVCVPYAKAFQAADSRPMPSPAMLMRTAQQLYVQLHSCCSFLNVQIPRQAYFLRVIARALNKKQRLMCTYIQYIAPNVGIRLWLETYKKKYEHYLLVMIKYNFLKFNEHFVSVLLVYVSLVVMY